MTSNIPDSSSQNTSCSVNLTPPISKTKSMDDPSKRRKSPFSMQKEIFLNSTDYPYGSNHSPQSLSSKRRKQKSKIYDFDLDLNQCKIPSNRGKRVTFKSKLVQVINVISYKNYYTDKTVETKGNTKCVCFIF